MSIVNLKQQIFERAISSIDEVKAERCRRSFYYFLQEFWPEVSSETLKLNWHMEYLCEQLQYTAELVGLNKPKERDTIINVPPGTSKSVICSIMFPAWCWSRWFWMRFINISYSSSLSLEHAETSRDLIRSDRYQRLFPYLDIKQDKDTKSNFRIVRKYHTDKGVPVIENGGNRYSTSVGGTLTGFHAHILIVDDPLNPAQAASEVELANANRWLDQTLSTRKIDKQVTPTILIMQRLHQNDPTGHILDKKKNEVLHICLPGEIRKYRHKVNPPELADRYEDELLDPVRMPWKVMDNMQAELGQYGYAGQIGQDPTPPGGGMFKVDHLHITESPVDPDNVKDIVRYWDKAGTAGGGCFTVGVKMLSTKDGKYIITDVKRGQWSSDERERIIKEVAQSDGVNVKIYFEQEPGSGGKESAEATIRNLAGFMVYADLPTGNKVFRADPYSVQVNNGNVILLRGDWNRVFIEEHRFFPHSTYKDQVDAGAGAFSKLVNAVGAQAWVI